LFVPDAAAVDGRGRRHAIRTEPGLAFPQGAGTRRRPGRCQEDPRRSGAGRGARALRRMEMAVWRRAKERVLRIRLSETFVSSPWAARPAAARRLPRGHGPPLCRQRLAAFRVDTLHLCGNQISGAPRHRRDIVSVAPSARWVVPRPPLVPPHRPGSYKRRSTRRPRARSACTSGTTTRRTPRTRSRRRRSRACSGRRP
jgi:hypothetical protein